MRAMILLAAIMAFMPSEKLADVTSLLPLAHSVFIHSRVRALIHPVEPETTGTPCSQLRLIFSRAAPGFVNSTATSAERKASLSKSAWLSISILHTTSWPRLRATFSISRPILP